MHLKKETRRASRDVGECGEGGSSRRCNLLLAPMQVAQWPADSDAQAHARDVGLAVLEAIVKVQRRVLVQLRGQKHPVLDLEKDALSGAWRAREHVANVAIEPHLPRERAADDQVEIVVLRRALNDGASQKRVDSNGLHLGRKEKGTGTRIRVDVTGPASRRGRHRDSNSVVAAPAQTSASLRPTRPASTVPYALAVAPRTVTRNVSDVPETTPTMIPLRLSVVVRGALGCKCSRILALSSAKTVYAANLSRGGGERAAHVTCGGSSQ